MVFKNDGLFIKDGNKVRTIANTILAYENDLLTLKLENGDTILLDKIDLVAKLRNNVNIIHKEIIRGCIIQLLCSNYKEGSDILNFDKCTKSDIELINNFVEEIYNENKMVHDESRSIKCNILQRESIIKLFSDCKYAEECKIECDSECHIKLTFKNKEYSMNELALIPLKSQISDLFEPLCCNALGLKGDTCAFMYLCKNNKLINIIDNRMDTLFKEIIPTDIEMSDVIKFKESLR